MPVPVIYFTHIIPFNLHIDHVEYRYCSSFSYKEDWSSERSRNLPKFTVNFRAGLQIGLTDN